MISFDEDRVTDKKNTILSSFMILFLFAHASNSQTVVVPVDIHLPILFKVLNLEKGASKPDTGAFIVAIIYESSNAGSVAVMNEILAFCNREQQNLMDDKSITFITVDIHKTKNFQEIIHATKAFALYVAPLSPVALHRVTGASQKEKMLSMTGVPEYVDEGVSLGVGVKGDSPEIIINLTSSKEEGSEFSSKVLGVARIVK